MNRHALMAAALAGGVAIGAVSSPSAADDGSMIVARIMAAQASQPSYRVTTTLDSVLSETATVIRRAGGVASLDVTVSPAVPFTRMILIGTTGYYLIDGVWRRSVSPTDASQIAGGAFPFGPQTTCATVITDPRVKSGSGTTTTLAGSQTCPQAETRVSILPDRNIAGSVYGAIRIGLTGDAPAAGVPMTSATDRDCTYDKATYLLHDCMAGPLLMTFDRYGDARNEIVVPSEAANARAF
jgi:hypothetical protein